MDSSNIYIIDGTTVLGKGVTVENYLLWNSLPKSRKNIREFRKISSLKFKMGDIKESNFKLNENHSVNNTTRICMSKAILTPKAKMSLKKLISAGKMSMGKFHHHETGGGLVGRKVKKVWNIDVIPSSFMKGEGDGTNVPKGGKLALGYANFHTHPRGEYKKQKVKYAWPSGDDYLSIMEKMYKERTVLHIVATVEGIYAISLSPKLNDVSKKNLETLFKSKAPLKYKRELPDITNPKSSPSKYLKDVRGMKNPIYTVEYRPWGKISTPFKFYFPPDKKGGCEN